MEFVTDYRTDLGRVVYAAPLRFYTELPENNPGLITRYRKEEILPPSLIAYYDKRSKFCCPLYGINPRTLKLTADDGVTYVSYIPFTGYTEEFNLMLDWLDLDGRVLSYYIKPEFMDAWDLEGYLKLPHHG